VPLVAVQAADDRGSIGSLAGLEAHGIHLMDTATGPVVDQILICLTLTGIGGPGLPNTVRDLIHVQVFAVPVVKIANYADRTGIGCPNTEHESFNTVPGFGVTTQKLVSLGAVTGVVVI
jgi:hypothetical protein